VTIVLSTETAFPLWGSVVPEIAFGNIATLAPEYATAYFNSTTQQWFPALGDITHNATFEPRWYCEIYCILRIR